MAGRYSGPAALELILSIVCANILENKRQVVILGDAAALL